MASPKTLRKREWLRRNEAHRKARTAVKNALQRGKMEKKPCMYCGEVAVEAHHNSYIESERKTIVWMCRRHHLKWHVLFVADYPE